MTGASREGFSSAPTPTNERTGGGGRDIASSRCARRDARAREGDRRTSVGRSVGRSVVGDEDARWRRANARGGGGHRVSVGSLSPGVESER